MRRHRLISPRPARTPLCQLPEPPSASDLASARVSKRVLALCFGAAFLAYVVAIPRFVLYSSPPTGDQPFYLMDTISLFQDRDLNLRNNYENRDEDKFYGQAPHPDAFVGISAPYPLPPQLANAVARPRTEQYGFHPPGLGVLLVPAWIVGSWFSLWWPATIVFMCLVGALTALNGFLLAMELTGRARVALAACLPIAFSGPIMSYSYLLFTELPVGLLLIYAFRRLALGWLSNSRSRLVLVGACIAYIPWLAWRCVPLAAGLTLYALAQWWRCRRSAGRQATGTAEPTVPGERGGCCSPVWTLVPVAVSAVVMAGYNWFLYGTPVPSSGVILRSAPVPAGFNWPWEGVEELGLFISQGLGLLFDRAWGLLVYSPIYLLAVPGLLVLAFWGRRHHRTLLLSLGVICLPYLFMITAFDSWHGLWGPPARFLTTLAPLAAAPLAVSLVVAPTRVYRALYGVLGLVGLAAIAVMMHDPRLMFNHPTGQAAVLEWVARSPSSPLHVDLRELVPSFVAPDADRHVATSTAMIVASFCLVLLAYALLARGFGARSAQREPAAADGSSPPSSLGGDRRV